jgi:hypothetical protein
MCISYGGIQKKMTRASKTVALVLIGSSSLLLLYTCSANAGMGGHGGGFFFFPGMFGGRHAVTSDPGGVHSTPDGSTRGGFGSSSPSHGSAARS